MSNTPTPPAGYKLVKGEDIKDCVPEGALIWSSSQCLEDEPEWVPSGRIGGQLYGFEVKSLYAIPETKPESVIPEVGPQPPKGYVLRHRSEMPEELPNNYMSWPATCSEWYVSTAKKLSAFTPEDVWFAIKADDAKVHQKLHVEAIESCNPLSQQEGGDHYKGLAIQPVEFIHANKLSFLEGCVVKRVCRHRAKNKAEDIRKAMHELRLILKLEYGEDFS